MRSNWTIAAIRGYPDDLGGLGPKVTPKPDEPEDKPEPTGIIIGPDGKRRTNLPLPDGPETAPTWPFPSAEPGAHGFLREPLKVGDKVRILDALALCASHKYKDGEVVNVRPPKAHGSALGWGDVLSLERGCHIPVSGFVRGVRVWERVS